MASVSGADSVRRRLSTIFQRAMPGHGRAGARPLASRARPRIHGRSCQSPRAQRCWRAADDEVVRRELVEQLDVGHQAGAGEDALEQVVAEQRVLGHPVGQRRLEGVDVVDPLAGEAALAEQVLVDVGDRGRVRVDAGRRRRRSAGRSSLRARPGSVGVIRGWRMP